MDSRVTDALVHDRTIDITTIGRKSGQPRRIEIWFHNVDGRIFITGTPGTRGWYANMVATPQFVFHLKESVQADLPATAEPIRDPEERRAILSRITKSVGQDGRLEAWVKESPLVEVVFEE